MEIIYGIYEHQEEILSDRNDNDNSNDVYLFYLMGIGLPYMFVYLRTMIFDCSVNERIWVFCK